MEAFGVITLSKAVDNVVSVIAPKEVLTRTERKILVAAEMMDHHEIAARDKAGGERDLVWPLAVHRRFAQLTFAIHHRSNLRSVAVPRDSVGVARCGRLEQTGNAVKVCEVRRSSNAG
jgi:hypothetical protein